MFLADWDTKAANRRLLCLGAPDDAVTCRYPVAMIQDLGATFGPYKLDLDGWRRTPVWTDADRCLVSMQRLPWGGLPFEDVHISEDGRRLLAGRLQRLSGQQIFDLFEGAGFAAYPAARPDARSVANWVTAFAEKVNAVAARGPCRATTATR